MEVVVRQAGLSTTDWATASSESSRPVGLGTEQRFPPCVAVVNVVRQCRSTGLQHSSRLPSVPQAGLVSRVQAQDAAGIGRQNVALTEMC